MKKISKFIVIFLITLLCIICFATCSTNEYTITFIVDGTLYTTRITDGEEISLPDAPQKNNYIFAGWYFDKDTWENRLTVNSISNQNIKEHIEVYALWVESSIKYIATFSTNGGTEIDCFNTNTIMSSPTTVRVNNAFNGWYTDESFDESTLVVFPYTLKQNTTFYAKWYTQGLLFAPSGTNNYEVRGYNGTSNRVNIPNIYNGRSVTSITSTAFYGNTNITEIIIPYTITNIEQDAFANCNNLDNVYITDIQAWCNIEFCNAYSNPLYYAYCLYNNNVLVDWLYLPNGLTNISDYAFINYSKLTGVSIPDSVTSIGEKAFYNCCSIISIFIGNNLKYIESKAFYNCLCLSRVYIDDIAAWCNINFEDYFSNPLYYAQYAYVNALLANELIIPEGVTSISDLAFYNCKFNNITLPKGINIIGEYAFYNCIGIEKLIIPDSVSSIGENAFKGCIRLKEIKLPFIGERDDSTVNTHFSHIFGEVPASLKKIIITGAEDIHNEAFKDCINITNITIQGNITQLGHRLFYDCTKLSTVILPESVVTIGFEAFRNCISLNNLILPNSVINIYENAFLNCANLTEIIIPDSVTNIGFKSLGECNNLEKITLPFVGTKEGSTNYTNFGSIFGAWSLNSNEKYVPLSLKNVTLTKEEILDDGAFFGCSSITNITLMCDLMHIGKGAFRNCSQLNSINLPDSITSIAKYAFSDCKSLNNIVIPHKITRIEESAFEGCYALSNIDIPQNVTSIGMYAFSNCENLVSVIIPDSVTDINYNAFYNCIRLSSVYISDIASWCNINFNTNISNPLYYANKLYFNDVLVTDIIIPDSVTQIKRFVFFGCTSLKSITINDNVKLIGVYAFFNCSNLTAVNINDIGKWCEIGFDSIYSNPLYYAKYLYINNVLATEVIIPNNIQIIRNYTFYGCINLTNIKIPDSVTQIGYYSFSDCRSLKNIEIPNSISIINNYAFSNCSRLSSFTIPNSVTSIGFSAFNGCYSLEEITLPFVGKSRNSTDRTNFGYIFGANSYTKNQRYIPLSLNKVIVTDGQIIDEFAFANCSSLTDIILPDSITSIGQGAFEDCTSLSNIIIGNNITNIGEGAFNNCENLVKIVINSATPPTFGANMLNNVGRGFKIFVPENALDGYKQANGWSDYAPTIYSID